MKKFERMPVAKAELLQNRGRRRGSGWHDLMDQLWEAYRTDESLIVPVESLPCKPKYLSQAMRRAVLNDQRGTVPVRARVRTYGPKPDTVVVWLEPEYRDL